MDRGFTKVTVTESRETAASAVEANRLHVFAPCPWVSVPDKGVGVGNWQKTGLQALSSNSRYTRFEVFTAMTMKNGVFWEVTPCGSCKNRRLGGNYRHRNKGE
jgi:hypothetical protein